MVAAASGHTSAAKARFGTDDEGFSETDGHSAAMIVTPLVTYNLSMTRFVHICKKSARVLENPTMMLVVRYIQYKLCW